ncbi:acyl-[acyl-carrier-protein]--UDP-N-acetylglucosamine O-acyltransferase [Candidatus Desantisbacteria bacterium CG2_30_40_21]|uniref:Acyl-[acyl-carrier-protein]--UDP-N-acetylglucosamine O-acyltransferase n=5 Tax=unclassified Candidatus Desantisiibacteriota TaxID=3106372 RepID=A0A2M7JB69_9BACT|nr:MAG: acyl-[acyl-carrier-protein]--UDP-N-acetylglucosamine O-acyltransferase [Candidatus Desantisbacteria bacterium CG2_30_40_21]PIP40953.1 MAG: acyl-[acyl-carrier-protein]--UDP-N-acetylglucosamine O-acyltransferase [Candidatus Desantisbacteria bacterium CG23_combo_of_CG06-09_8_20_14_all_40_23]PIX16680.1 MAG: acyl-[acyl-carrier-protein]--UDP-N-acetylglucosamine O-acyltransferase [Candidatus Desantisbacteria bacterium CG_4_8_14_3_um_filter_40_12]PIY18986.1 MAG: acyl-[acyl-carrier-protein]--UDP-
MIANIHPTAIIHPEAQLGEGVTVGPFAVIGERVKIGHGSQIGAHAILTNWTTIGMNCEIHAGVVIGDNPQIKGYKHEESYVIIGNNNVIREYVTIHRGWHKNDATRIGNDNFFMANVHIAHDCQIGDNIVMANYATLGGHVVVEDNAFISGLVGIHQFVRIGRFAMIGGCSKVVQDVTPYALVDGHPAAVSGLNMVGMRRAGISSQTRGTLKKAYHILYHSNRNTNQALSLIRNEMEMTPELEHLVGFVETAKRGICRGRKVEMVNEGGH